MSGDLLKREEYTEILKNPDDLESITENLFKVQEVYFHQRDASWSLLEESLRIDMDEDHGMHALASRNVTTLLNRYCLYVFPPLNSFTFINMKMSRL